MGGTVIRAAIIYSFCVLGAYATTDILRLLNGATMPVWKSSCYCLACKAKIRVIDQMPVFSYIRSGGRCRNCNSRIPLSELILEVIIIAGFTAAALWTDFSWKCFMLCMGAYEMLKIGCCFAFGIRKDGFAINFVCSLLINAILYGMIAFFFLLAYMIR